MAFALKTCAHSSTLDESFTWLNMIPRIVLLHCGASYLHIHYLCMKILSFSWMKKFAIMIRSVAAAIQIYVSRTLVHICGLANNTSFVFSSRFMYKHKSVKTINRTNEKISLHWTFFPVKISNIQVSLNISYPISCLHM